MFTEGYETLAVNIAVVTKPHSMLVEENWVCDRGSSTFYCTPSNQLKKLDLKGQTNFISSGLCCI